MNTQKRNRFLLTQSLLSSWQWSFAREDGYADFLAALKRERTPPTSAMLEGNRFESVVNAACKGRYIEPEHEWYKPVTELAELLTGAQQQVKLSRDITVGGIDFVLYGVLDFLKAGVIYDTKFSKTYKLNKYITSPQHPMYFALAPEARLFQYLVCDGEYVYRETYYPGDTEPVETRILHFMNYLDKHGLVDLYCEKWRSQY